METPIKPSANPAADERGKPKINPELLEAAQAELMRHTWDTFLNDPPPGAKRGSVVPGCVVCRKVLYTDNQYLSHLAIDILPGILERILQKAGV